MFTNKPIDISGFRHLYPFQSRFMDMGGLNYHYIDEGRGEPVIMVHGNPTWSFYYRRLIQSLSGRYRAIAPDHIGCGLSDKPPPAIYDYTLQRRIEDLDQFIGSLTGGQQLTLIVHDWGGMIGMAYALRNPARISRLIVLNTAAFLPPNGKKIPLRLHLVRNAGPLATIAVQGFNLFAFCALHMASHRGLCREVKNGLIAPYNCWKNRIATLKFVQDIPLMEKDSSYHLVKQADQRLHLLARIPMLVCWGERDFVFDTDYLAEWRRRFPDAEVHRFPEAGHYVLEDVPDQIISLITDFLNRHPETEDRGQKTKDR